MIQSWLSVVTADHRVWTLAPSFARSKLDLVGRTAEAELAEGPDLAPIDWDDGPEVNLGRVVVVELEGPTVEAVTGPLVDPGFRSIVVLFNRGCYLLAHGSSESLKLNSRY